MSESQRRVEEEQCCEDWWHQDRLDAIGWAAAFFWGGLVLLAETTSFSADFSWWNGWSVFFVGAGVIVLLQTAVRVSVPRYQRSWVGSLIFALVLLGFGLGGLVEWAWYWPLALMIIAVLILRSAFAPRR